MNTAESFELIWNSIGEHTPDVISAFIETLEQASVAFKRNDYYSEEFVAYYFGDLSALEMFELDDGGLEPYVTLYDEDDLDEDVA